jgi:hypothetical protein
MLGSLDNEVVFKKAFTDKFVFEHFVKDITGLVIDVNKIETNKKFPEKIGLIDFEYDIFAESKDKRFVVEIQKIEYDHNFDRFLHYFLSAIIEQQKNSKKYSINRTVYTIVILTAPYTLKTKDGDRIQDAVLLSKLNPRTLEGIERNIFPHQLFFLNHNYNNKDLPKEMMDWLTLMNESINNPEKPKINKKNEGIKKASELISYENLTPAERTAIKQAEGKKVVLQLEQEKGFEKGKIEGEVIGIKKGQVEKQINNIIKLTIKKLGDIPTKLEEKIKNCTDIEKLDQILDNIFDIISFDEIETILE